MLYFFKIMFPPPPAQGFAAAMAVSPGQCAVHSLCNAHCPVWHCWGQREPGRGGSVQCTGSIYYYIVNFSTFGHILSYFEIK